MIWGRTGYVREPTRKDDWGELARRRIHQLPSNIVRTSLRYSSLSHAKEWTPASGKEEQGPLSEVISLLAILFAVHQHRAWNTRSCSSGATRPVLMVAFHMGGLRGSTTATELPSLSSRYPVVRTHGHLLPSCFITKCSRFVPKLPFVSCDFLTISARVSVIFLSRCY